MIYLELFLVFLKVGAFCFGGGYAMIAMIHEEMMARAWLPTEQLLDMIAVAESTPGPIAVNMATFVGSSQGGFWGALCATLGVVLPSFIVILMIAAVLKRLLKYKGVRAFLSGLRPAVVALILATALTMLLSQLASIETLPSTPIFNSKACILFTILVLMPRICQKIFHKKPSPILMVILSAGLGILLYGILPRIL